MKKIALIFLLCLMGCTASLKSFIFDGVEIPMDTLTLVHRATPLTRERFSMTGTKLNEFIELFNRGQLKIRKFKTGTREIELIIEKDGEITGTLIGFRNKENELMLCLNDEEVCRIYHNYDSITNIEGVDKIEETYKPMILPVNIQGFEGYEPAPLYFSVIEMEKGTEGDIYTYVSAGYNFFNGKQYLMKPNGELDGPVSDETFGIYNLIYDHVDEYDQRKLLIKDGEVTYLDWSNSPTIKAVKSLQLEDFKVVDQFLVVNSMCIQAMGLSDYFRNSPLTIQFNESDEFLGGTISPLYQDKIKVMFDKATGKMVTESWMNEIVKTPIVDQVQQALKDIPVCSKYYEDNYELSQCYEPYVYQEGKIDSGITLYQTQFEINESGQIVLPVLIREKGAYADTIKIEINKE